MILLAPSLHLLLPCRGTLYVYLLTLQPTKLSKEIGVPRHTMYMIYHPPGRVGFSAPRIFPPLWKREKKYHPPIYLR